MQICKFLENITEKCISFKVINYAYNASNEIFRLIFWKIKRFSIILYRNMFSFDQLFKHKNFVEKVSSQEFLKFKNINLWRHYDVIAMSCKQFWPRKFVDQTFIYPMLVQSSAYLKYFLSYEASKVHHFYKKLIYLI